jgi:cytochrome c oxidase subunit 2
MRHLADVAVALMSLLLAGCDRVLPGLRGQDGSETQPLMWIQSVLAPGGPHAEAMATLSWVLFIGSAVIFVFVAALTVYALFASSERAGWLARHRVLIGLGIVFPVATLSLLLVYGSLLSRQLVAAEPPALRVEITGEQFWWRVRYVDGSGAPQLVSANEIRMPTGRPVEFVLRTKDVIHSFWIPSLAGKLDMIPGRTNVYRFAADAPGIYRGQCAEYCGMQHALMAFYVVAMPQAEFDAWYARESRPAAQPVSSFVARGGALFEQNGCGACHTVRGTASNGQLGPDLTHIGSRQSIAAGTFPVNRGTLAGWISSAQHLKPGNLMPSFGNLQGEELRAIAAYLESLT